MDELAKLSAIPAMLAEANSVAEVKHILDVAEAARTYARKAKLNLEVQNSAAEASLRSQRRAGELLAQLERDGGPGRGHTTEKISTRGNVLSEYKSTLDETGTSYQQAHRWQTIAAVPQEAFERHVFDVKAEAAELTSAGVLRVARELERAAMHMTKVEPPPLTGRYDVLYVDPPWRYEHSKTDNRKIENHYPTMELANICALSVAEIAADSAVLFLWATSPKLHEAMQVIDAWGFTYRTCMVWDKERMGMGYYARQQHELLLIAAVGAPPVPEPANRPVSVIRARRDNEHSRKPTEFYEIIERMYPKRTKVELFARIQRDGWDTWGNEPE